MNPADCLSLAQAAALLGVQRMRAWQLVNEGVLPARRIGRAWIVQRPDVERLVKEREARG